MAENLETPSFGNFSIESTMGGMGSAELLNDLMSPETASTSPDEIKDINAPEPEKAPTPEKKSPEAPKEERPRVPETAEDRFTCPHEGLEPDP